MLQGRRGAIYFGVQGTRVCVCVCVCGVLLWCAGETVGVVLLRCVIIVCAGETVGGILLRCAGEMGGAVLLWCAGVRGIKVSILILLDYLSSTRIYVCRYMAVHIYTYAYLHAK